MKYFVPYNDSVDTATPIYTHDCLECTFVGNIVQLRTEQKDDVYVCGDSIITRHSSEKGDYQSGSLSDYMHILLQPAKAMSDQRWIICQLFEKGILAMNPVFNLPTK